MKESATVGENWGTQGGWMKQDRGTFRQCCSLVNYKCTCQYAEGMNAGNVVRGYLILISFSGCL
jgi:hypothetical protein